MIGRIVYAIAHEIVLWRSLRKQSQIDARKSH